MRQILQLGQIGQFPVQRVDHQPAVSAAEQQHRPHDHGEDVVGENHVVDDREEEEGEESYDGEDGKGPQPRHDFVLVLFAQCDDQQDAGVEDDEAGQQREQGEDDEGVADWPEEKMVNVILLPRVTKMCDCISYRDCCPRRRIRTR